MITLKVPDMTCAHCVAVITKALRELDPAAVIGFDLHAQQVQVDTIHSPAALLAALDTAGYPASLA